MTRMFSSAFRLSAGSAARAAAIVILIAALAGVASAQQLSVSPTSLLFAAAEGSTTAQTQAVTVWSSGNNIFWYAQIPGEKPGWLTTISPASGVTTTNPLNVTVNPTGLVAGNYSTTVQVYSPYSTNAPSSATALSITVNLIVGGAGTITADKSTMAFTATVGGANPATQTVRVTTASTSSIIATTAISYTSGSGWLSVSPTSGTLSSGSPLDLTVSVATGSLATNAYVGRLTISSGSSTQTVTVTFNVQAGSIISADPNPVPMTAVSGSTTAVTRTVTVTNSSGSSITVTPSVSSGSGWLSTNPANPAHVTIPGLSTGNITFSAVASGLSLGTTVGQVTLTPSTGNAIQVPVNFLVTATSTLTVSRTSMSFSTSSTQSDTFALSNSSASGIGFDITVTYQSSTTGWLQPISPTVGTVAAGSSQTISVTANASGLGTGNYYATINVVGGGQTQTISVTLSAGGAVSISANPTSLTINSNVGSPASGTVTISSNSATTVSLTNGTSITCTPSAYCATANTSSAYVTPGSPASFYITSSSGLAYGTTYYATLTFQASVGGTITVPLTIYVGTGGGGGTLTASPSSLSFSAAYGGALQTSQVYLSATSYGTYTATSNQSWLNIGYQGSMSASVYAPGYMTVYANPAGLSAGTYSGTVTIYGSGGSLTIYTTFVVGGGGGGTGLTVSPTTLALSAAVGGQSTVQTVSVYGYTQTYYYATVQSGSSWLILTQSSGNTPGSITLYANASGLTTGTYYGYVSVTSTLGSQTVTVTLTVGGGGTGNVSASPSALSFVTPVGGTPNQQSVVISAGGAAFTAAASTTTGGNWLSVSPTSANSGATLYVSVTNPGLAAGGYTGQINISSVYGNLSVPVTLTVGGTPGAIMANPTSLQFTAVVGGLISSQSVTLTTSSSSADYTISGVPAWMSVSPQAATITPTAPVTLTVYVNPGNLAAGTYNGSIVIAGGGGSAIVQVTFSVGGGGGGGTGGGLTATPGSLTMSAPLGSTSTVQQYISLTGYLPFNAYATTSTGAGWLSVTPASGTAPASLLVQANPAIVSTGSYSGSITVYTSQGSLLIPVTFNVGTSGGGVIQVSPSALSFSGQNAGTQYVSVSSSTGYSTYFSATATVTSGGSWLSVSPSSGVTPVQLTVTANPAGLAVGSYYGYITILGSDGYSQQSVQVTLTVTSTNLTVTPASLAFTAATGGSAAAQTLSVSTPLVGSIPFTASASASSGGSWLTVSPNSGNTPTTLSVTVNAGGLYPGAYSGSIVVSTSIGAMTVPVTLNVTQQVNLTVAPETLAFEALAGATSIPTKTISVSVSTGSLQYTATAATTSGGSGWLQVTPASGMTPGTLTVTASATGLNPGVFNGTVTVSAAGASNSPRVIQVTLTITSPAPIVTAVLNAAAGRGGILAAGTIVSIYGTALAAETAVFPQIVSGGLVPTQVGDVRVLFDGVAAPILYAQAKQVNTVIPWSLFGRTTVRVEVEYKGNRSAAAQIQLYDAAPGIFSIDGSGLGQGAILNQDGGVNSTGNGAATDSVVAMYATGMGQTEPQGVDGAIPTQVLPKPMLPVSVLIGNSEAEVTYGGAAPYLVSGAMQVNARIPRGMQPGAYAVTLRIGRFSSQLGVTIVVK